MSTKREQIIETTCQLMEMQGYHATGLNQILAESDAPKGSLYYYFPDGKEGLAIEAIAHTGSMILSRIEESMAAYEDAAEAVRQFILNLAFYVEKSDYQAGGPITAVALESASTNERLTAVCHETYQSWQNAIEEKLRANDFMPDRAQRLAALIIAALEGGIILSRTERSQRPLQAIAEEIYLLLKA